MAGLTWTGDAMARKRDHEPEPEVGSAGRPERGRSDPAGDRGNRDDARNVARGADTVGDDANGDGHDDSNVARGADAVGDDASGDGDGDADADVDGDGDGDGDGDDDADAPLADELDLHTFLPRECADVVAEYVRAAQEAGLTSVRIIHGKGTGTLRRIVHGVLERHAAVRSFRLAGGATGGWGATLVELHPAEPTR